MTAKITSALPDDDHNGLTAIARQLISEPDTPHYAVVRLATHKITTDVESGDITPTVRIKHIEVIDGATADRVLLDAYTSRTGRSALPFDEAPPE